MAFYQFHYDPEIINKLPFIKQLVGYVYKDSAGKMNKGFLCEVRAPDFEKIKKQLTGQIKDADPITAKDKVYILPNCSIPGFKLKEYFNLIGATQTADIKEATRIIGHERIVSGNDYKNSALLKEAFRAYNAEELVPWGSFPFRQDLKDFTKNTPVKELGEHQPGDTLIDYNFHSLVGSRGTRFIERYFITPTCAIILYYKLLNKIPVINETAVFQSIQKPLIIDKEVYESLNAMIESSDESNRKTAIEIISNCDIEPSRYYLWKLIRNWNYTLQSFSRSKNFRLFKEKIKFDEMVTTSERSILVDLEKRGLLTPEIYEELINEIIKTYSRGVLSEFFDITLTPSERYQKYSTGLKYMFKAKDPIPEEEEEEETQEEEES